MWEEAAQATAEAGPLTDDWTPSAPPAERYWPGALVGEAAGVGGAYEPSAPAAEEVEAAEELALEAGQPQGFAAADTLNMRQLGRDMALPAPAPAGPAEVVPGVSRREAVAGGAARVADVLQGGEPRPFDRAPQSVTAPGEPTPEELRRTNAGHLTTALTDASGLPARLLVYEPEFEGVGRMAVALGTLEMATHVAVLIPGMGSSPASFDELVRRARVVYDECRRVGPEAKVAVIAWQGYRAPRDIRKGKGEVSADDPAKEGSKLLNIDLAQWRAFWKNSTARKTAGLPEQPQVTVNGFSYGSVVAGYALMRRTRPGGVSDTAKGALVGGTRELSRQFISLFPVTAAAKKRLQGGTWTQTLREGAEKTVPLASAATDPTITSAALLAARPVIATVKRSVKQARAAYKSEPLGGGEADYLVLFGSPGTGRRAQHLNIPATRIYAAAHAQDPISHLNYFSIDPTHTRYDPTGKVTRLKTTYIPDPALSKAKNYERAHTSYYDPATETQPARESLTNLARITTGNIRQVTTYKKRTGILLEGHKNPLARPNTNPPTNTTPPNTTDKAKSRKKREEPTTSRTEATTSLSSPMFPVVRMAADGTCTFTKERLTIQTTEKTSTFWGGRIKITHPEWLEFKFEEQAGKAELYVDTSNSPRSMRYSRSYLISWKSQTASGFYITPENEDPWEFDSWNPVTIPQRLAVGERLDVDVSFIERGTNINSLRHALSSPTVVQAPEVDADLLSRLLSSQNAESAKKMAQAAQDYVDGTIRKVLKRVVPSASAEAVSLDGKFVVTFLEAPATGGTGLRTTERYTLREVALGVPYRKTMLRVGLSVTILKIEPSRNDLPVGIVQALTGDRVRSGIAEEFSRDADLMAQSEVFKTSFSQYPSARLRSRLARYLADGADPLMKIFSSRWLDGSLKEKLVVFQGKIVPDVVAIGSNESSLLVSLATGDTYVWRKDDKSSGFQTFIKGHLAEFDSAATRPDDFIPTLPPDPRIQRGDERTQYMFLEPRISFREVPDTSDELRKASIARVKSNLNGYVYTKAEEDREWTAQFGRAAMQGAETLMMIVACAATGGAGAVVAFASGLGFGFGSAYFNEKIAENTDRGDVYRQALEDAELDRWLTVGMSALDFKAALSGIRTGVKGAERTAAKLIRSGIEAAQEKVLLSQLTPRRRAARMASKGAGGEAFTGKIARDGAVCWDAVAEVQRMADVITPQELLALRGVRAHSFQAYLGGTGKEITNLESLTRLDGGYRVAFIVDDNGRPQMIHAMLSTGDGKLAGLNNGTLRPELSPGFAEVDFKKGDILTISDDGMHLPDGRRVRIYTETSAPEFRIEARRPALADPAQNTADISMADRSLSDLRRNTAINAMIDNPAQNCENLVRPTRDYMKAHGFTDIKYRGMAIWDNALEGAHANHYVVLGKRGGKTYVFDLSAGQFAHRGMPDLDGPIIATEAKWAKMYQDSTTRKLIKYQDFATSQEATDAFRPTRMLAPRGYMPGSTILTAPHWY
ncbi:alpha/beta hydrolase [Streptomyces sp. NPDC090442]|uniref:alpha/beta hydrolase n=1 Tax=Streptomyces sp. NPDC090442 TaxID=3365962 RepID=UPI003812302B